MKDHRVRVRVRFKDGILDPQAEVIYRQIHQMEFSSVESVTCEKSFVLVIQAESEAKALDISREVAQKLLVNVVMESFEVEAIS